jgi:hypothetical protein
MAIAIRRCIFDIRFFLPRAVSFPPPQPSTEQQGRSSSVVCWPQRLFAFEVRRCGDAAQALSSDACAEPMIRALRASGVRDLPFACFTSAKGNLASPARNSDRPKRNAGDLGQADVRQGMEQALRHRALRTKRPSWKRNGQYRHGERTKAAIGEQRKSRRHH